MIDLTNKKLLPENFADESRAWIYQSNREFTTLETVQIEKMVQQFVTNWKSHGDTVKGFGAIFFNRFVILLADETAFGVSGCSTDGSVRVIKEIEQVFGVNMFDRQQLAFIVNENIQTVTLSQLNEAIAKELIDENTIYFDNTILTKKGLMEKWAIPVKNSWVSKRMIIGTLLDTP